MSVIRTGGLEEERRSGGTPDMADTRENKSNQCNIVPLVGELPGTIIHLPPEPPLVLLLTCRFALSDKHAWYRDALNISVHVITHNRTDVLGCASHLP